MSEKLRLARQDEVIEKMVPAIDRATQFQHSEAALRKAARDALSAMLDAVVELNVARKGFGMDVFQRPYPALILQLEEPTT